MTLLLHGNFQGFILLFRNQGQSPVRFFCYIAEDSIQDGKMQSGGLGQSPALAFVLSLPSGVRSDLRLGSNMRFVSVAPAFLSLEQLYIVSW